MNLIFFSHQIYTMYRQMIYIYIVLTPRLSKIRVHARSFHLSKNACQLQGEGVNARSRVSSNNEWTRSRRMVGGGSLRCAGWRREADGRGSAGLIDGQCPRTGVRHCVSPSAAFVITNADWTPRTENRRPNLKDFLISFASIAYNIIADK